jgi:hypothetical protein
VALSQQFEKAGFTLAAEKSDVFRVSAQQKEYLGFLINTATMSVEVPGPKLDRVSELLKKFYCRIPTRLGRLPASWGSSTRWNPR